MPSDFLTHLREERARIAEVAKASGLEDAVARLQLAERVLQRSREYGGRPDQAAYDAFIAARERVSDIQGPAERAKERIVEIDRILNAKANNDRALRELNRLNSLLREARADFLRYQKIEAELQSEIEAMERAQEAEIKQRGIDDLKSRINGAQIRPFKASVSDQEIRARRASLEALATAKSDAEAQIAAVLGERKDVENQFWLAKRALAEIEFFGALAIFAPTIAALRATGSSIGGHDSRAFTIDIDRDLHEVIRRQFDDEIEQA